MIPPDCPAYRIVELPRLADPHAPDAGRPAGADPGRAQRASALAAAYHAGVAGPGDGTIAFGWLRAVAGGPVRLIAAGRALVGSADAGPGEVLLALPGGARATALPPGRLAGLLDQVGCWRAVAGISDGLLVAADGPGQQRPAGAEGGSGFSLDQGLLGSWTGPFGWLVVAQPVAPARLQAVAAEAGRRQRLAEGSADRFPERAVQARRLKERQAELQRGVSSGLWRVTIMAGGEEAASAARVAGLLCASADLAGLPYRLCPGPEQGAPAASALEPGGDAVPAAPFYGSSEFLAALAQPPGAEVPGVRLALRPEFDVTPERLAGAAPPGTSAVELGEVLDRNLRPAGPLVLPRDSLNRHVFVCGATGAGKSQTVRSLLEAATGHGIPWLVVEPAKAEYRLMAARLPGVEVIRIRPGEPDAIAAGLNPLEPAADADGLRFPLQTHADLVRALFIASFRSEEPFPQVLSAALGRVYADAGWDLALGEPACGRPQDAAYPTLTGLQRAAEQVVTEIGYSQRVTDDVLGFIRVRLASLRQGTTGRFLEGGHPLDFGALLARNAVLEIEDVGDDADKAFLIGTVLIRLVEYLRLTHAAARGRGGADGTLRHLTVVEEAHRLLRRTGPGPGDQAGAAGHAVEMFAGLLAEIRAYGEGLVIAEQIPARLVPDVIKNTAVKIVHRLPAADDREAVGATMNATPAQSRYLVTLPPGRAAVFSDGMDFPILVAIREGIERERASPGLTSDARTVVRPRSATCGSECQTRPCTLRDMRAAQRALDAVGWVRLWAELAVLAHLTGWPIPAPVPGSLAAFAALPARVRQCALSHAVDAAVAVRGPAVVSAGGAVPALAAHVLAAISAWAERAQWLCPPDEPQWRLAGAVTEEAAFGVGRPSVIESAGPLPDQLAAFVDCQWPLRYLKRP
jgi:DNA helicase HerA-like ATPase